MNSVRSYGLGADLINLHGHLYIWGFWYQHPPPPTNPLPSQNSGDPLYITIWLTLSNVPAVQASFTSDTDGEPRGTAA